ncbi:myotoxin-1-like [Crotalus tigris]|uniref:myotoxin-1-like n=1 Tax=Crotalus tigris TaxID=88082 RepID=UPI00192F879E|nr:myotoxin-1-like [Crotalus tigris]
MKILYLLFAFLFLAFLSEPGNAQPRCRRLGGKCFRKRCPPKHVYLGRQDCWQRRRCCKSFGKWKIMPSPSRTMDIFKIWPRT